MLLLFFFFSLVLGARRGVADQRGHDAALWASITSFCFFSLLPLFVVVVAAVDLSSRSSSYFC